MNIGTPRTNAAWCDWAHKNLAFARSLELELIEAQGRIDALMAKAPKGTGAETAEISRLKDKLLEANKVMEANKITAQALYKADEKIESLTAKLSEMQTRLDKLTVDNMGLHSDQERFNWIDANLSDEEIEDLFGHSISKDGLRDAIDEQIAKEKR